MHIVIDLINGDELIVESYSKKKEEKKELPLLENKPDKLVRKQVINIDGEIVSI